MMPPCLFALGATRAWGEQVAHELGWPLSALEEREFEDGEHKSRPVDSVRGRDVFVLHSLYADATHSAADKLCRLLFFIGTLKGAAAARVCAVMPYLAYARKDRRTQPQDPVTSRYVASLLQAVGTDRVMTLDVHNLAAFENAFSCPTEHLEAASLFARFFADELAGEELTVVSPDAGGVKRAEALRLQLEATLRRPVAAAFAEKHRALGVVRGELLAGEVAGRCAIVVDDLVSTGGTLLRTAHACRREGALRVWAAATHGLFVGGADAVLGDEALSGVVVSDSVPPWRLATNARNKLRVLSAAPLFAQAIARVHAEVSHVMAPALDPAAPGSPPGASGPMPGSGASAGAS